MAVEVAPLCESCRLVGTKKIDNDIYITLLHQKEGFVYFSLSELADQRVDIQAYISNILPKVLSGVYEIELMEMEEDLI